MFLDRVRHARAITDAEKLRCQKTEAVLVRNAVTAFCRGLVSVLLSPRLESF
jgi:hypothetical protein